MKGMKQIFRIWLMLCIGGVLCVAGCCTVPKVPLPELDKVNANLYRSGQPNAIGIEQLKAMGIRSVLNLRDDEWPTERDLVESCGMQYRYEGLSPIHAPSLKRLNEVMVALRKLPPPTLVHCKDGWNRTGVVIGAVRIDHGWPIDSAWADAELHGASSFFGTRSLLNSYYNSDK